jgi:predicted DNA binding CopG/RHH family protein
MATPRELQKICVRVSRSELAALKEIADRQGVPYNHLVRVAINELLAKHREAK